MKIEIRADGESMHISGYVNAVGRDSRPIITEDGRVVEMIEPGAFGKAIERAENVDLLLNHNDGQSYASTKEQSMSLKEDNIGLRAECDVTDKELIQKAKNHELRGWSFGFRACKKHLEERAGTIPRRHVEELEMSEVSLIDTRMNPCYVGTSIEQRAETEVIYERRAIEDDIDLKVEQKNEPEKQDYSSFDERIKSLKSN